MTYFLIWSDYDGSRIEEFGYNDKASLLKRLNELKRLEAIDMSTTVDLVVLGNKVEYLPVEVVTEWKIAE